MLLDTDAYLRRHNSLAAEGTEFMQSSHVENSVRSASRCPPQTLGSSQKVRSNIMKNTLKGLLKDGLIFYTVCATLSAPTGRASSFNLGLRTLKQTSQRLNIPQTNIPQVSATSEWHTKLATTIYRYTYMYSKVTSSKLTVMIRQCCSHKYYFESWNTPKRKTQNSTLTNLRPKHESSPGKLKLLKWKHPTSFNSDFYSCQKMM